MSTSRTFLTCTHTYMYIYKCYTCTGISEKHVIYGQHYRTYLGREQELTSIVCSCDAPDISVA